MTTNATELLRVAERLDDFPMALLNGGASEALQALAASESEGETVATSRGIDPATVNELWQRADACLRQTPEDDAVFSTAAEAASLLYAAAWVLESDSATTEDVRDLL